MDNIFKYIALDLILFLVSIQVFAYRLTDKDVDIDNNGLITHCHYKIGYGGGTVIEIPDVLQGIKVTGIGPSVFSRAGITELILPSTLKTIGDYAFYNCAITSLDIPRGVVSIGNAAFAENALAAIKLPDGLESIGVRAFEYNQLTALTLPNGLVIIASGAFRFNKIASLSLPTTLVTIGAEAFYNNKITSLVLPNSLITIGDGAFSYNEIASLILPNSLITIESRAFSYNRIASLKIPKNIKTIGNDAFRNNNISVLNFEAGSGLQQISMSCFRNNNIQELTIPNSILIIEEYAFAYNPNLNQLTLNQNLLRIKRGAFFYCNLSPVNFPASLIFIGRNAFAASNKLSQIKLPTSDNHYQWYDSNGVKHNEGESVTDLSLSYVAIVPYTLTADDVVVENGVIVGCSYYDDIANIASVLTIPAEINGEAITGIGSGVFWDKGISEVILPNSLQDIFNSAFEYNEIVNLVIPNSVINIGESAFRDNCINTLTFEATSQVETIGMWAFNINRLTHVDFPNSIIIIDKYAFQSNWLQSINFEANSHLVSIGSWAFYDNWEMSTFKLPDPKENGYNDYWVDWDNVEYRNDLVVSNYETFYKIPIVDTLTSDDVVVENGIIIGYTPSNPYANILTIPDILDGQQIIGIGQSVFYEMGLIGINLPSSLQVIQYGAFAENDILSVTIPANVEEIQNNAFSGNIIVELDFEENSILREIGNYAFSGNKIESLTLPDNLSSIAYAAFANNNISEALIIPDNVENIGYYAFANNQIPQLIFGENSILSYLGRYAFWNNNISNTIIIPKTLTEIPDYAFLNNDISEVITHNDIIEYGYGAFLNNNPNLTIQLHIPPTIPLVTYFFWWKDVDDNHYDPREATYTISNNSATFNFNNRYKAVIDEFFVVKFVVTDDNNDPIENASIDFFYETLLTNKNGIDSLGPVLRGFQEFTVSGVEGCYDFAGAIDVQDNMTVYVQMKRYYEVNINVLDSVYDIPIEAADIAINGSNLSSNSNGNAKIDLIDGDYPFIVQYPGYQEFISALTVHDADTIVIVELTPVFANYFPNEGNGDAFTDTTKAVVYTIANNPYSRNAYTFSHWNSKSDDSEVSYAENETINLGFTNLDFYAIWKPVEYNIVYHLDGGSNDPGNPDSYNVESDINFLPASKPTLYFATWLDADSNRVSRIDPGSTGDIELWALFTPEPTYFIDYHNLENATHSNQTSYTQFDLELSFTDAIKTGYEFLGWFEDSMLTKQITNIPVGSTIDYDIYAKWGGAIEYAIDYELDGGINNPVNPNSYNIESNDINFESPSKTGANFVAWFNNDNFLEPITQIPTGSIGDTTLYAKWILDTFNIQYVLYEGINDTLNPAQYTIESENIAFESPSKTGVTFNGWYSDDSFLNKINDLPKGSYGDTTLYAKWELNKYKISYMLDGGTNSPSNPEEYTIESEDIVFESPSKDGARFVSWYNDENLVNQILHIPNGTIGDTTIYAKWVLDTFSIEYVLNDGINDSLNPSQYTIESNTILFEEPH